MIILAVDPGFDKVGYSIFEKIQQTTPPFRYIGSNLIKTNRKDLHEARLKTIYDALSLEIAKHKPEVLVIEKLFFTNNQKTALQVSQAIGVIELVAAQSGLRIIRLTPLQIKEIVTGDGQADKKSVEKMIRLTLNEELIVKDDDQADAIACGLAFCYLNEAMFDSSI